ncbi:MAG TPA: DUF3822 family protein [Cyclobacteriaceae bacterium]
MQVAAASYKLIKKIKDERFDEEKLHQYLLLINIGVRDFQVAVIDSDDSRLIFFEDYVMGNLASSEDLLSQLQHLFEAHPLLMAGFWKQVKVGFKNPKFVQVPSSLFVASSASEYLRFNSHFDETKEVVLFNEQKSGAITVFAIYKNVFEWLSQLYINTKLNFIHQSAALIEGVTQSHPAPEGQTLYLYVDRFKLHLLSVKGGHLVYYNQFVIKQFSDYIKYVMLVMKALNKDQQKSRIVLWGYLGKNSPHYNEFIKYVRNVSFGERPANLKFGYLFDELQEHHFFDLYSLALFK